MIIIKNLFRIILILVLFTIIAQSKESDKINKNEWDQKYMDVMC